jgi:ribosome maturation factor RimP
MEVTESVRMLCEPVAQELGIELYDIERVGGILRISVDQPGGIPMDLVTEATRRISRLLDEYDPVPGAYTLEVGSPGLERNLRLPAHFTWAVGRLVSIRTRFAGEDPRRIRATVLEADDDGITVDMEDGSGHRRLSYPEIDRARSVFEWGPKPKPGKQTGGKSGGVRKQSAGEASSETSSDDDEWNDPEVSES